MTIVFQLPKRKKEGHAMHDDKGQVKEGKGVCR